MKLTGNELQQVKVKIQSNHPVIIGVNLHAKEKMEALCVYIDAEITILKAHIILIVTFLKLY